MRFTFTYPVVGFPLVVSALVVAQLGTGCEPELQAAPEPAPAIRAVPVETITLAATDFSESLDLRGVTQPVTDATVAPSVGGHLVHFPLEEGDRVKKGSVALRTDVGPQRAVRRQARSEVKLLEAKVARARKLVDGGVGTVAALEELEGRLDTAKEVVSVGSANVGQATVRSPIAGVVVETFAEEGEFVGAGKPVARIIDTSTIVVEVGLRERDILYVSEGMGVRVRIDALDNTWDGKVTRIGHEADKRSRTFPMEIEIDNADGALRSGMRARVALPRRVLENVIVVPRDAVLQAVGKPEVMIVDSKLTARAVSVELGPGLGGLVVVEEGLAVGDRLIVRGQRSIFSGTLVAPKNSTLSASLDPKSKG